MARNISLAIIGVYVLVALAVKAGWVAAEWSQAVGASYQEPSLASPSLWLGTDLFGRSVILKLIQATANSMGIGILATALSVPIGLVLGSLAGYFGRWVDAIVVWVYTTLSSIPGIILLIAITYAFGKGSAAVIVALSTTSWIGLARVIRGEVMKHRQLEYVVAAEALGASHRARIFRHIFPNVMHLALAGVSIQFVTAIKAEAILSFLGIGLQGIPSLGVMIDDARNEIVRGIWWGMAGASIGLALIVMALSFFGDSVRDALDPKLR